MSTGPSFFATKKVCLWHGQLEHLKLCFRETVQLGLVSRLPSCMTFPPSRKVMLLAFPVLGLRQPPAQERVFLCVRGGRGMRVANACAHLLEYGDFTVRLEVLVGVANLDEIDVPAWRFLCSACKCTCTSLPLRETRWTGDTNVDIGRAGCRLLGRLQQCLPRSDVSFEFGLARARGQQHCPQHREHLLSSRRNSDGPRFHIWHTGSSESSFARLVDT